MARWIVSVLLVSQFGLASPAVAAVSYDGRGRVQTYQGTMEHPFTTEDLVVVGALATALPILYQGNPAVVQGLGPLTLITWGAWRTAKYRPESVKAQIRSAIAARARTPVPGSLGELLQ